MDVTHSLSDILQVTFGVSSCGAVAWLGFKLLLIMTRHNILLTGQCVDGGAQPDQEVQHEPGYPRRYRYRLRIQSLEAARTEYPLEVTIKGIPSGSSKIQAEDHVWTVAGWKAIAIVQDLRGKDSTAAEQSQSANRQNITLERDGPYVWRAVFQELPGFDAWSFDVVMPCERLEFSVAFLGTEERKFFAPTFGRYFEPDHITVFSSDREEPRIRGSVTMPRLVVPVILSIMAIAVYVLVTALSGWRVNWSAFTTLDRWLIPSAVLLIWIGYAFIRRPVYPVISGYRYITPPWPNG